MRKKLITLMLALSIAIGAFALPTLLDGGVDTMLASGHDGGYGGG